MNQKPRPRYRIGVDVGGTFTDIVAVHEESGDLRIGKVLTTPGDPSVGVLNGISDLLASESIESADVMQVIHATTLIGNAIIEHKGGRCALICTRGFRDVLTLRRMWRYDIYDSDLSFPPQLVPRRDRFEVNERVAASGEVIVPLLQSEIDQAVGWLKGGGFEAVAICLLHSFRNDEHERLLGDAIRTGIPDVAITLSSEVLPQIGEYERTCVAVMNASAQPLAESYLDRLVKGLQDRGLPPDLLVMSSNGGLLTAATAARFPIGLLESGPVAGALGAANYGSSIGDADLLSFDMGGTTAKACTIRDGAPTLTNEFEVARVQRLTKGSGLPVKLPAVDMLEIGAGGGSIARIDDLGLIVVGPDSVGADPGPICYGRGGHLPTVTDANLILGYLNPDFFLGGSMKLAESAAEAALDQLGGKVGLSAMRVSWGIHEIVSQSMATALRTHAIEKGFDYRHFSLIAFGGAGPIHAYRIASLLNIPRVIFPSGAGVFSALGLLTVPLQFDAVRTRPVPLQDLDGSQATGIYEELEGQLRVIFGEAGLSKQDITIRRTADLRYVGQGMEITLEPPACPDDRAALAEIFERAYAERYGWGLRAAPIEIVNWRCTAQGPSPDFSFKLSQRSRPERSVKGSRRIYMSDELGFQECFVFDRYALASGVTISGPALVEERECTVFIGPGATASIDEFGSILMRMDGQ